MSHLHLFVMLLKILTQELDARTPMLPSLCLYTETKPPSFLCSFSTSYAFKDRFPSWATALQQELISSLPNTTCKCFPELLLPRQGVPSLLETPHQHTMVLSSSLFPKNFVICWFYQQYFYTHCQVTNIGEPTSEKIWGFLWEMPSLLRSSPFETDGAIS